MSPITLRVRALRHAKGWTQTELAAKARVRQATISKFERPGSSSIGLDALERVARALGVAPGDLLVVEPRRRQRP